MAMTLRLNDDQDRILAQLAESDGVSKHEAALRAILDQAARRAKDSQVRSLAREAVDRYGPLLDRLAR